MLSNPQPKLTFGALNLIGTKAEITANGYCFEAIGDDTDWGDPVPVTEKVLSWLQDGAIVALKNYDNRELNVRVRVVGTDLNKLAIGESALMLETGKPNLLTWTPPDGVGAPSVFSVVTSSLEFAFDDLNENRITRMYALRIVAEPFVRSQTLASITRAAPSGSQTTTAIDTCASATNWATQVQAAGGSQTTSSPSVVSSSYLLATTSNVSTTLATRLSLVRTGLSQSLSGSPYIRLEFQFPPLLSGTTWALGTSGPAFKLNGIVAPVAVQSGNVYWFDASALSITTLNSVEVTLQVIGTSPTNSTSIALNDVSRSNVLGDQSSYRQLSRTLSVVGSARTQASLAISDASNALGSTLVYTCPAVAGIAQPNLRQYLSSGNSTTSAPNNVTAVYSDMGTLHTFDIPTVNLLPGGYLLLARMDSPITGTPRNITWAARSRQGSTNLSGAQTGVTPITFPVSGFQIFTLATMNLPPRQLGPSGRVRIEVTGQAGMFLDEAWLFNIETGQLTWVECGTAAPSAGGTSNRLWIDAATVQTPQPSVWRGFASDRSDSFRTADEQIAFDQHQFTPPAMTVFTVTTNSTASSITLSHFPRFHTHAVA